MTAVTFKKAICFLEHGDCIVIFPEKGFMYNMNKTILSDIDFAKKTYPIVLHEIRRFYFNKFLRNIENSMAKNKLFKKLHEITGKDIDIIDSYISECGWTSKDIEENFQSLSFVISLPEPKIIENITEEEILEIYKIVKSENFRIYANDYIEHMFYMQFNVYFQDLLEINLKYLLDNFHSIAV